MIIIIKCKTDEKKRNAAIYPGKQNKIKKKNQIINRLNSAHCAQFQFQRNPIMIFLGFPYFVLLRKTLFSRFLLFLHKKSNFIEIISIF